MHLHDPCQNLRSCKIHVNRLGLGVQRSCLFVELHILFVNCIVALWANILLSSSILGEHNVFVPPCVHAPFVFPCFHAYNGRCCAYSCSLLSFWCVKSWSDKVKTSKLKAWNWCIFQVSKTTRPRASIVSTFFSLLLGLVFCCLTPLCPFLFVGSLNNKALSFNFRTPLLIVDIQW